MRLPRPPARATPARVTPARVTPALVAIVAAALLLAALAQAAQRAPARELRETRYVFGTLVELVVQHQDTDLAARALAETGVLLNDLNRAWHAWHPGPLTELNTAFSRNADRPVSARLARVLRQGQQLACESGGLFEPGMGSLIALWGFHADTPPSGTAPRAQDIAVLQSHGASIKDLHFDGTRVWSGNTALQLDLGGYAKGAALDQARDGLRDLGIRNAVLNAGGDVHVMGQAGARPWRVAIRDPFVWGAVAAVTLAGGEGLYTSGNYERFFEQDGQRFAHILDPRTGWPTREIVSASVIHENGARADAAATALSVAGPDLWAQVAADMGISQALLITQEGGLLATPAMAERLEWVDASFARNLDVTPLPPPQDRSHCAFGHASGLSALQQN